MSEVGFGALTPPVTAEDHAIGPSTAPVTLVEYGDFQCPYCARAHPILRAIRETFGSPLRFVFRNFPITELHRNALQAAEAAESVAAHAGSSAYWHVHDAMFEHQHEQREARNRRAPARGRRGGGNGLRFEHAASSVCVASSGGDPNCGATNVPPTSRDTWTGQSRERASGPV